MRGGFGEALGERAVNGCDQNQPRKRISPLAEGRRVRDEFRDLQSQPSACQPTLKQSQDQHRRLSSEVADGEPSIG
jgi:hypothetical protein